MFKIGFGEEVCYKKKKNGCLLNFLGVEKKNGMDIF